MKISEINSMSNSAYLVVLYCATAGKNGEDLGIDEEQIVLLVYLLYDVPNNKVGFFIYLFFHLNPSLYFFHVDKLTNCNDIHFRIHIIIVSLLFNPLPHNPDC